MSAEPALKLELQTEAPVKPKPAEKDELEADLGGTGRREKSEIGGETAEKNVKTSSHPAPPRKETPEISVPSAEELREKVTSIRANEEEMRARFKALSSASSRTPREEKEFEMLDAKLKHLELIEKQFKAATEIERSHGELEKLAAEDEADKDYIERMEEEREIAERRHGALLAERAEKATAAGAGGGEGAGEELDALNARIEAEREEVEAYQEGIRDVRDRMRKRRGKKKALSAIVKIAPAAVLTAGAAAAEVADAVTAHERAHEIERLKEEREEDLREIERQERLEALREAEERAAKMKPPIKERAKSAARLLPKAALAGAAVGTFGAAGGFVLLGRFFKTWAHRISDPGRFIGELVKRYENETAEPPNGKGELLGTIGTGFWLLLGDLDK